LFRFRALSGETLPQYQLALKHLCAPYVLHPNVEMPFFVLHFSFKHLLYNPAIPRQLQFHNSCNSSMLVPHCTGRNEYTAPAYIIALSVCFVNKTFNFVLFMKNINLHHVSTCCHHVATRWQRSEALVLCDILMYVATVATKSPKTPIGEKNIF
jgi:hypothetical protein